MAATCRPVAMAGLMFPSMDLTGRAPWSCMRVPPAPPPAVHRGVTLVNVQPMEHLARCGLPCPGMSVREEPGWNHS